jgi:ABC-type transport system involved in cytochrome c biogenesis permease subunit
MGTWSRYLPILVVGTAAGLLALLSVPPADNSGAMHIYEFGRIPVYDSGRVKPLDSVARNYLSLISDRQYYYDYDKEGKKVGNRQPAIKWLLNVMAAGESREAFERAAQDRVFRITNDQLLSTLGLEERPDWKVAYRYAIAEFAAKFPEIQEKAQEAKEKDPSQRDAADQAVLTLFDHLALYVRLARGDTPFPVPPAAGSEDWSSLADVARAAGEAGQGNAQANAFRVMLAAYAQNDAAAFNRAVADYRQKLERQVPAASAKGDFEFFFNNFEPFLWCRWLYVAAFLLVCFSWVGYTEPLNRSAFWLLVLTLAVHGFALFTRMYLSGRWFVFVTNLYSSAIFIGWVGALVGLVLERIFRNGIGNLVAAVIGCVTVIIADNLAAQIGSEAGGDTIEQLRAVLDTNFWLATHVTCITMGYAATFIAGLLGVTFILRGVLTRSLDRDAFRSLTQALYGVVCFATLLSFTGTVLGGIWADQSWGRFWGWDPKENGALIIVIWNALILHARWGGMVKQRGMAVLAVFGNIVTLWSWFGVNMLGVGLHAYGFIAFNAVLLAVFIPFHLAVMGLGLIPTRGWRSFGTRIETA